MNIFAVRTLAALLGKSARIHALPAAIPSLSLTARAFHSTPQSCAPKTRSSTTFTFATRFPRPAKSKHRPAKPKKPSMVRVQGLAMPVRHRLVDPKVGRFVTKQVQKRKERRREDDGMPEGWVEQDFGKNSKRKSLEKGKSAVGVAGKRIVREDTRGKAFVRMPPNAQKQTPSRQLQSRERRANPTVSLKPAQRQRQDSEKEQPQQLAPWSDASRGLQLVPADAGRFRSFTDLGVRQDVAAAVGTAFRHTHALEVQELGIRAALENDGDDSAVLVAGETGCGKTLAYLIPLFHYLKNEEDAHGGVGKRERDDEVEVGHRDAQMITTEAELRRFISEGTLPLSTSHSGDPGSNLARPRHPRAIILVPTRELVLQTTRLAKQLSHHARLRIFGTLPRYTLSTLSRHLHALPVDVLITTPGTLLRLTDSAVVNLSSAKHVVVDEADTILDPTQSDDEWTRARALLGDAPRRYTFTTATLPKAVLKGLENEFPSLVKIGTRKLHRPSGGSKHYSFLYIDRSTTKLNMLLDVLRRAVGVDSHVLVFCNTRSSARKLTSELRDLKYDVVELSSDSGGSEAIERLVGARESGSAGAKVYVATDMASRGIDTRLCTHVVMYDFPSTAVDFLHRAGRTGRGGGKGRVTCIVGRREVRVAEGIEKAVRSKGVVA